MPVTDRLGRRGECADSAVGSTLRRPALVREDRLTHPRLLRMRQAEESATVQLAAHPARHQPFSLSFGARSCNGPAPRAIHRSRADYRVADGSTTRSQQDTNDHRSQRLQDVLAASQLLKVLVARSRRATSPSACRRQDGDRRQDRRHVQRRHRAEPAHGATSSSALSRVVGKEGKNRRSARSSARPAARGRRCDRLGQRADRRPGAADHRDGARHRRRRQGRPVADDGAGDRGPAAEGRVPAHRPRPSTRWSISSARSPRR